MARDVDGLEDVISDGFSRYLLVDVLHGTDRVAADVYVESWSLPGDLDRDPKTSGTLRIVHPSEVGESWVPRGAQGILSPYRATLLLTEVISVGAFERRVQLGVFDVVGVPFAEDVVATVGARWVERSTAEGDIFPPEDIFIDVFPGELTYEYGELVGGTERVVATVIDVEVESLDGRVLGAALRSPRTAESSAWAEWRAIGLLPVAAITADATLPPTTWPAERGSRLDAVQTIARRLGGVPVVDSVGQWTLVTDDRPTIELHLGANGTIVDLHSALTLDDFANVVIGDYEDERGRPIRATWVAPGLLSPEAMGREIVTFHSSDQVRTQSQADAAVAAEGARRIGQEVDVLVTCVYDPRVELGDRAVVPSEGIAGIVQRITPSDEPTMQVTVRVRRAL